jgi:hypothetical protein
MMVNLHRVPVECDDMVNPYVITLKKRDLDTVFGVWKISGGRLMIGNIPISIHHDHIDVWEKCDTNTKIKIEFVLKKTFN